MKQPKISPKEYSETLNTIELSDIVLVENKFMFNEQENSGGILSINIVDKYSFNDQLEKIDFYSTFKINGIKEVEQLDSKKVTIFSLNVVYKSTYNKKNKTEITNDFFDIFKNVTLSMLIWPYVRELTQNTLTRAGLPPLTIPLRRMS